MRDKRASVAKGCSKTEELLAAWGKPDAKAFPVGQDEDSMALCDRAQGIRSEP